MNQDLKQFYDQKQTLHEGVIHYKSENKQFNNNDLFDPNVEPLIYRLNKQNYNDRQIHKNNVKYNQFQITQNKSQAVKNGLHTIQYNNGCKYVGELRNSKKHGKGIMYNQKGSIEYEGDWQFDTIHGWGIFNYADGSRYEGQWENWQQHGKGVYYWNDGSILYQGIFQYGKFRGKTLEEVQEKKQKQFQSLNWQVYGME